MASISTILCVSCYVVDAYKKITPPRSFRILVYYKIESEWI